MTERDMNKGANFVAFNAIREKLYTGKHNSINGNSGALESVEDIIALLTDIMHDIDHLKRKAAE